VVKVVLVHGYFEAEKSNCSKLAKHKQQVPGQMGPRQVFLLPLGFIRLVCSTVKLASIHSLDFCIITEMELSRKFVEALRRHSIAELWSG
jgi:hypothetical protein